MLRYFFLTFFFVSTLLSEFAYAQCGITPKIEIEQLTAGYAEINSSNSPLDSNWIIIENQHYIDGVLQNFNGAPGGGFIAAYGLHEITYRATVTDTITGDTCTAAYTNIFVTTGPSVFVGMDQISVNGMDVSIMPQFHGDYNGPFTVIGTIWGDGTIDNNFFHTYTNPGIYSICVYVDPGPIGLITQGCGVVHVSNGNPQMTNWSAFPLSNCQQIQNANFSSVPQYNGGFYAFEPLIDHNWNPPSIPAGGMPIDTFQVPGQYVNVYGLGDPNAFGQTTQYLNVFTVGTCDITPDTVRGVCWYDINQNGLYDSTEFAAPGETVQISNLPASSGNYSITTDSNGMYEILMPRIPVFLLMDIPTETSVPPNRSYTVFPNSSQVHNNYNFGIIPDDIEIRGRVALDTNGDSIVNTGDIRLNNVIVTCENVASGFKYGANTNSSGDYKFSLPPGNYKLYTLVKQVDSSYTIPDTIIIPGTSGNFSNRNFSVQSSAVGVNLSLAMISQQMPRPGFSYGFNSVVANLGADTASSTLVVDIDPLLLVQTIIPSTGTIDSVNHTVTWNVPPLTTGSQNIYTVICSIPSTIPLGTPIANSGTITLNGGAVDTYPGNNTAFITQIAVGSFDPNDKLVNPEVIDLTPGSQNPDVLFYHINFQNTGTASATNVVVEDEIDPLLDFSTLNMIDASHTYTMIINDRTVNWIFSNINLPDSNNNEPNSHGWIEYTIRPLPNLPIGTSITNEAAIYFDFNAPIYTNTTTTEYVISTGVAAEPNGTDLIIYPNPANTIVNIRSSGSMKKVSVYNSLGGLIEENALLNGSKQIGLSIEDYSSGIYLICVDFGDEIIQRKLIK